MPESGVQAPPVPEEKLPVWRMPAGWPAIVLCTLALMYTAYFARVILIPIAFAVFLYLLLGPFVRLLNRRLRLPMAVGAVLSVFALGAGMGSGFYLVSGPAAVWMEKLPSAASALEKRMRGFKGSVDRVSKATEKVEKLTEQPTPRNETKPVSVVIKGPSLGKVLLGGTTALTAGVLIVSVLLLFLLATGETILRHVTSMIPALRAKKMLVEVVRETEREISHYLTAITLINIGLGISVGIAMWALGVPNPLLWGSLAAVLNFVPYLGCVANMVIVGMVALVTFDDLPSILAPPLVVLALNTIEGQLVTPLLVARRLALNPVAVLLSLIVWGWMWGIPGTLVAVPLIATAKIVCERTARFSTVGALLGRPGREPVA